MKKLIVTLMTLASVTALADPKALICIENNLLSHSDGADISSLYLDIDMNKNNVHAYFDGGWVPLDLGNFEVKSEITTDRFPEIAINGSAMHIEINGYAPRFDEKSALATGAPAKAKVGSFKYLLNCFEK